MSWLDDIQKSKSAEDKKKKKESALAVKRVRGKAKTLDSIVQKHLDDFGKACWGSSLFSDTYVMASGLRGEHWIWSIEHLWNEKGVPNAATIEVHLRIDPTTKNFEYMLVEPEKLFNSGPRYPCNQEGLRTLLREVFERWLDEAYKYDLKK